MGKDWFNDAVSAKPQTVEYILPRMALTMTQPDHIDALRRSCHQQASRELRRLHDEDKLTSDHQIVLLGAKSGWVYHTVIMEKDRVVFDSSEGEDRGHYNSAKDIYHTRQGDMIVNARICVDDFFRDYVAKVTMQIPRNAAHFFDLK